MSAEGVAQFISAYNELIQGECIEGSGRSRSYYETREMLKFAAETVKHFGYVKSQEHALSTAAKTFGFYSLYHGLEMPELERKELEVQMKKVGFNHNSKDTIQFVENALKWISEQEETNNYMHNLKTVCASEYIKRDKFGFLVSLIPMFDKNRELQAKRIERENRIKEELKDEMNSAHVGKVGERISIEVNSVKCVTSWATDYGTTRVYKIIDIIGNVFIWKTGKFIPENIKSLKGTVKEHKEYREIKQTELTRCNVKGGNENV